MKRRLVGSFLTLALFALCVTVQAQDKCQIVRHNGDIIRNAVISDMTKDEIKAEIAGGTEKIPVGDVKKIVFSGEPAEMDEARGYIEDSRFEDAIDVLKNIDPDQLNEFMKMERDFLIVRAMAGRAFAGSMAISDVLKSMDKYFSDKANQNFYRFYEVTEIYGNLNTLIGTDEALSKAGKAYGMLSKAKDAPILKARGLIGSGNIFLLKKDAASATKDFKEVLTMVKNQELEGVKAEMQVAASCGLARAAVLEGKNAEATQMIQKIFTDNIITAEDPLNAQLYNALGFAQLSAKKPKDAAISYMHTHLLYNSNKQFHVEALDAMINIFRVELRDETRAAELEGVKAARYGAKKK
ncbi:MAG: hypothetical protein IJU53_06825 [Thermoguttaceae bacterium]|nr:hypothetical protein [Thermoguttaceae bacterium]